MSRPPIPEFELTIFRQLPRHSDDFAGRLRSPLLQGAPYKNEEVPVQIGDSIGERKAIPMDTFILNSIVVFLRSLEFIGEVLYRELLEDRKEWAGETDQVSQSDLLACTKNVRLGLRQKSVNRHEALRRVAPQLNIPPGDTEETWAYFELAFECPWDDEHGRCVTFRDGLFDEFRVE